MARLNSVTASRKELTCAKCGQPITVGSPYFHFKPFGYRKRSYHVGCKPTAIEMETNDKRRGHMTAVELLDGAAESDSPENVALVLADAKSEIETVVEEIEGNLENWENAGTGMENHQNYADYEATRDDLNDWLSEIESHISTFESIDNDVIIGGEPDEPNVDDYEWNDDGESESYDADYAEYERELNIYLDVVTEFENAKSDIPTIPDLQF